MLADRRRADCLDPGSRQSAARSSTCTTWPHALMALWPHAPRPRPYRTIERPRGTSSPAPNSRAAIERQMLHLSPEMRRKLTRDNAAALYGLGR